MFYYGDYRENRWRRNRESFHEVCHGRYGREILKSAASEINASNILDELAKVEWAHRMNAREIDYLDRYFRGDQPCLYKIKEIRPEINNKVIENHAFRTVLFFTSRHFGEPIQYANRNADEDGTNETDTLNKLMFKINKPQKDVELGLWQVICGTAFRKVEYVNKDIPFRIRTLDPRYTYVIYDNNDEPILAVQEWIDENGDKVKDCFTDKYYYKIRGDTIESIENNGLQHIPIIEFPLNSRRLSYLEIVTSILDAINKVQSNRLDGIEQFVQSYMKFVNCDIEENEFLKMCRLGALKVKTANPAMKADVESISTELDQSQVQTYKNDLVAMLEVVLGMPSREQNTGGDTGNAVYLRNGWDFTEGMAKLWEPFVRASENKTLDIVAYILKWAKSKYKMDIDTMNVEVNITRNKTDNMQVKAQTLQMLLQSNVHPKDALEVIQLFSDTEKTYVHMEEQIKKQAEAIKQATVKNTQTDQTPTE